METSTLLLLVVLAGILKGVGSILIWLSIAKNFDNYIKSVRVYKNENDKG
jgi:hypothetical protein